jgi:hypothetical protein
MTTHSQQVQLIEIRKNTLPLYQTHLAPQLTKSELLILNILINLLHPPIPPKGGWVRLESLANRLPLPISFEVEGL